MQIREKILKFNRYSQRQWHKELILKRFYDQLLDVRIRLQKVLVALNSLPQGDEVETYKNAETEEFLNSAKEQAYSLLPKTFNLNNVTSPFTSVA